MCSRWIALSALLLVVGFSQATSAAEKDKANAQSDKEKIAAEKAARLKAAKNIASIIAPLRLSSSQRAKARALLSKRQWDAAVSTFTTARETDIHEHAHNIARKTIPGMMRKFMPGYMRSKIMASRRKSGRRGPPSGSEIAKIRKDAQSKMQPAMRKTVMPALDKLTKARLAEMLQDEKVMTRMLADRIIKANVLGDGGKKQFASALDKAGYPASLTTGQDAVLNDRTKKMLKAIDLKQIVKAAGL